MVFRIIGKTGRRKGEQGITIQLQDQATGTSKSVTTHGLSLAELYPRILLYLKALEKTKGKLTIVVEDD